MTHTETAYRIFDTLGHNGFHQAASTMREQVKRDEKREPAKVEERSAHLCRQIAELLAGKPEAAPSHPPDVEPAAEEPAEPAV